jgi:hypothetical protein
MNNFRGTSLDCKETVKAPVDIIVANGVVVADGRGVASATKVPEDETTKTGTPSSVIRRPDLASPTISTE